MTDFELVDRRTTLLLVIALLLLLSFAGPAGAHGGEGESGQGPIAPWMAGLLYIQLFAIPVIGIWLTGEILTAWRRSPSGSQHEEA